MSPGVVRRSPDGPWAEPRARPMAHPVVEGGAEDHDVGAPRGERGDIGQEGELLEGRAAQVGRQVEVVPLVQQIRAVRRGRVALATTGRCITHGIGPVTGGAVAARSWPAGRLDPSRGAYHPAMAEARPRYTIDEANALVPQVRAVLLQLAVEKGRLEGAVASLRRPRRRQRGERERGARRRDGPLRGGDDRDRRRHASPGRASRVARGRAPRPGAGARRLPRRTGRAAGVAVLGPRRAARSGTGIRSTKGSPPAGRGDRRTDALRGGRGHDPRRHRPRPQPLRCRRGPSGRDPGRTRRSGRERGRPARPRGRRGPAGDRHRDRSRRPVLEAILVGRASSVREPGSASSGARRVPGGRHRASGRWLRSRCRSTPDRLDAAVGEALREADWLHVSGYPLADPVERGAAGRRAVAAEPTRGAASAAARFGPDPRSSIACALRGRTSSSSTVPRRRPSSASLSRTQTSRPAEAAIGSRARSRLPSAPLRS